MISTNSEKRKSLKREAEHLIERILSGSDLPGDLHIAGSLLFFFSGSATMEQKRFAVRTATKLGYVELAIEMLLQHGARDEAISLAEIAGSERIK